MEIKIKTARKENYSSGRSRKIKYIVIHYTGNCGDTAENNAVFFGREAPKPSRSAHFFVDENSVWQSVPAEHTAWHVSSSAAVHPDCRNSNSIGVEICMLDKRGYVRQGSIDNAAAFVRELMRQYNIPPENVIRHYDVTRKHCPEPMVRTPALWQAFKTKIQEDDDDMDNAKFKQYFDEMRKTFQDNDAGQWSEAARQWAIDTGLIAGNGETVDGEPNYMWGDLLTREQLVTVLFRFAQQMGKE